MNKDNTQLEWEHIPEKIVKLIGEWGAPDDYKLEFANDLMRAIKPIVENAWFDGWINGHDLDADIISAKTYYNSLITKGI